MSIKNKIIFTVFIAICVAFVFCSPFWIGEKKRKEHFFVFNTPCSVTFWGCDTSAWDTALAELLQAMQSINDCLNVYDEKSELSRLNATAADAPFKCSDQLWDVLAAAREAWRRTEHAYDPSVGPLMRLWGFHAKRETVPTQEEIDAALETVGLGKVVFDDAAKSVMFSVKGMSLDCGGIAKGYGCDVAAAILKRHDINTYIIDLGGNLMLSETPPRGQKAFHVAIRDPRKKGGIHSDGQECKGVAVATSGNYERSRIIDGRRVGHIMDPVTGRPGGEFFVSVTAITPKGVDSDAFSTAGFVRGEPLMNKLSGEMPGTSFTIIYDN